MAEGPLVASEQELQAFAGQPGRKVLTEALRGVLAETATTGCIRYDWQLLKPLCHSLIDTVLAEYAVEEQVEVGPPRPMADGGSLDGQLANLHSLLDQFTEAPFTMQRLCEVLLEPRKQYRRLDKLAAALEKLLLVTSTVPKATNPPPRPALSALGPVNDNPPSPYLTAGQAGQQQLPNGQGPAEGGGGGAPGPGRDSPVFRMLMGAASANAAAAAAACGEDGGAAAATTAGGEGEGGVEAMSAEDAAEAELAKRFVEDALRTDPEPGSQEQQQQAAGAAPALGTGLTALPPTASPAPEGALPLPPEAGGGATAAAGGRAAAAASPGAAAAGQQGPEAAQEQQAAAEQAAAAMEIDAPPAESAPGGEGTAAAGTTQAAGAAAREAETGAEQLPDAVP